MTQFTDPDDEKSKMFGNACCHCGEIKTSVQKYKGECGLCSTCSEEFERDLAKD